MIRGYLAPLLCLLGVGLGAGALGAGETDPVARVNGVDITREQLERGFAAYLREKGIAIAAIRHPARYKTFRREALDALVTRELLWQEATKKNTVPSAEDVERALARIRDGFASRQAFLDKLEEGGYSERSFAEDLKRRLSISRLVEQDIAGDVPVSDEEIHDFYVANLERLTTPEEVRVRHILIKVDLKADPAEREAAHDRIKDILAQARDGVDFAGLAQKHSQGPTAATGGDLGFFSRGKMVRPFDEAAFALKPGEISDVVQTIFGYHVIKQEGRRGGNLVPEQAAVERIRAYLSSVKTRQRLQERVQTLRSEGAIEILPPL